MWISFYFLLCFEFLALFPYLNLICVTFVFSGLFDFVWVSFIYYFIYFLHRFFYILISLIFFVFSIFQFFLFFYLSPHFPTFFQFCRKHFHGLIFFKKKQKERINFRISTMGISTNWNEKQIILVIIGYFAFFPFNLYIKWVAVMFPYLFIVWSFMYLFICLFIYLFFYYLTI